MKILIIIILILIFINFNKKKEIKYNDPIDSLFKFANKNNDKFLSIKELLNNFDSGGRQVTTEIFLATIIDYDIKNKTNILQDNKISLDELKKISKSDLKLNLFNEKKMDKNNNFLPQNKYSECLIKKAKFILDKNI